jgi:predicted MPP superfamily phosphohydrolase
MPTVNPNVALGAAGLTIVGGAALGWSLIEAHVFQLRFANVAVLPPGSASRSILHLSDLHMTPAQNDKQRWVEALAGLNPDLVVVTGDFLAHRRAVPVVLDALGPLLDRPGFFTLGSNDYLAPRPFNPLRYLRGPSTLDQSRDVLPWGDLVAGLTGHGWVDLDNAAVRVDLPQWSIDARGVDDPHIQRDRYDVVAGPFEQEATLKLGVTHAPYRRVLSAMATDGADLILAGHTHGGQICLPGYGAIITNCDLDRKRAKGLSTYSGTGANGPQTSALHVSAGLGTSPYTPIRFFCPPEATLLTLTSRRD